MNEWNDIAVIAPTNDIDLASVPRLREQVDALIDSGRIGWGSLGNHSSMNEWNDIAVIAPTNDIDLASVPRLREQVDALIDSGVRRILVNCQNVTFIDSTGLAFLLSRARALYGREGLLSLVNASLREQVDALIDSGVRRVLVNCQNVTFIDSTGLAFLLSRARALYGREGHLSLVNASSDVARFLQIARQNDILHVSTVERPAIPVIAPDVPPLWS